ncbi:hypothetical protein EG328_001972 [Venturia inaequalis]|uniref:Uncharacterized protein n=1 Tax=Venturia inaequalis TaxID=5025 RepID=A0A8H3UZI1_VENIN|nr:hypothetical protein EG328_001972 [Venturia inaequalis]
MAMKTPESLGQAVSDDFSGTLIYSFGEERPLAASLEEEFKTISKTRSAAA